MLKAVVLPHDGEPECIVIGLTDDDWQELRRFDANVLRYGTESANVVIFSGEYEDQLPRKLHSLFPHLRNGTPREPTT